MHIIVGLGNPGQTFHGTRHNVGFDVIQRLAEHHAASIEHRVVNPEDGRPAGVYGEYRDGAATVRLLMPLTMMNASGEALKGLDVPLEQLLIVCDDVNLPLGALRLRPQGSAGGHNGLASCLSVLGTEAVPRLRIGVGTGTPPGDLEQFVLSRFAASERPQIQPVLQQAVEVCEAWVRDGIEATMNRYNAKAQDTT